MLVDADLKFVEGAHGKVVFLYARNGVKGASKQYSVDKLPGHVRAKLEAAPAKTLKVSLGIDFESKVELENGFIVVDLAGQRGGARGSGGAAPHNDRNQPAEPPRRARIVTSNDKSVTLSNREAVLPEKINVTDKALGLAVGNELVQEGKGPWQVERFAASIPILGGRDVSIDDNPYNFVPLGDSPTEYPGPHPDHGAVAKGALSGSISLTLLTQTPVFVPEGFPFRTDEKNRAAHRAIPRHFFRMKNAAGELRYAIPGSGLKGAIRSAFEAVTNSHFGAVSDGDYSKRLPYRRRVFQNTGVLESKDEYGNWTVRKVDVHYLEAATWGARTLRKGNDYKLIPGGFKKIAEPGTGVVAAEDARPYRANLLNQPPASGKEKGQHKYSHTVLTKPGETFVLPGKVVSDYLANLESPHYRKHYDKSNSLTPAKRPYKALPLFPVVMAELAELAPGTLIYFTSSNLTITTFGKNVNYMWPASQSVGDLCWKFYPLVQRSLEQNLSLAERVFGFAGEHKHDAAGNIVSHPFRGKVRFTTGWGPAALSCREEENWPGPAEWTSEQGMRLELAPLTAPETRAKARPLYLKQADNQPAAQSLSFDDPNVSLRGRKFYWHQKPSDGPVWKYHRYDTVFHENVADQCPPPLLALKAGTSFTCEVHFENLTPQELGALLFVLEGDGTYTHGIKLGKAKARGLGTVQPKVEALKLFNYGARYRSLTGGDGLEDKTSIRGEYRQAFLTAPGPKDHLDDFRALHTLPAESRVCAYPVNFRDYTWLPVPNQSRDPKERPAAMKMARAFWRKPVYPISGGASTTKS